MRNRSIVWYGLFSFLILFADLIDGSQYRLLEITGPNCLATHVLQFFGIALILALEVPVFRKRKVIKVILAILASSIIVILLEPKITELQYELTRRNLELICDGIDKFHQEKGNYPEKVEEIYPVYLDEERKSGFGLFNGEIEYVKESSKSFHLNYRVKYGYSCSYFNCEYKMSLSTFANCAWEPASKNMLR